VKKRYLMSAMARNLGLIMRKMFGFGKARSLQANGAIADAPQIAWLIVLNVMGRSMALFRSERSTTSGENSTPTATALARASRTFQQAVRWTIRPWPTLQQNRISLVTEELVPRVAQV
jgi:hypothetical protein